MTLFKGRAGHRRDNIASMFLSTSAALIFTEITGVVAILIDGAVTSRFLGVDAYSGISLAKPFTGIVLVAAGFLSTGCSVACSGLVGKGKKDEANSAFNLACALALAVSALLTAACFAAPTALLTACGAPLNKYPGLDPYIYDYLRGIAFGVPAQILIQVMGPVLTMDSGKRLFTASSAVLCAADVAGDLLNVFVFHGGALGMGLATSAAYMAQFALLCVHFLKKGSAFRFSAKSVSLAPLRDIVRNGTPAFVKKFAVALRDIALNYINAMIALTAAAIAARGIQSDLFLFCLATGFGRALVTMAGICHGANDLEGLTRLYMCALKTGVGVSAAVGAAVFAAAPLLTDIYTDDPEVFALAVFSIRWMAVALVFDMVLTLIQHYLQGIGNMARANALSFCERMAVPVSAALLLGLLFGSKGLLASVAVSKIVLLGIVFAAACVRAGGLPRSRRGFMFLPEGFGGSESDNLYARIETVQDAVRESARTRDFCLEHAAGGRVAMLMALFVEEMAVNVVEHNERKHKGPALVDMRLYVGGGRGFSV